MKVNDGTVTKEVEGGSGQAAPGMIWETIANKNEALKKKILNESYFRILTKKKKKNRFQRDCLVSQLHHPLPFASMGQFNIVPMPHSGSQCSIPAAPPPQTLHSNPEAISEIEPI